MDKPIKGYYSQGKKEGKGRRKRMKEKEGGKE